MKKIAACVISLFILLFSTQNSFACTTFCLKNNGKVLFGKNYDWMIGDGLIFVNKRGVSKTATSEKSATFGDYLTAISDTFRGIFGYLFG